VKIRVDLSLEEIRAVDLLAEFQGRTRDDVLREAVDYYFALDADGEPDAGRRPAAAAS
jgi:hypothetical protein